MEIQINDRFKLVCDAQGNKYLLEKKESKKGDEYEAVYCGYHRQFKYLLKWYYEKRLAEIKPTKAEQKTRDKEDIEIISLLDAMKKIEEEILTLTETIGDTHAN